MSLFAGDANAQFESKFGRLQCDPHFVEYVELFKRTLSATEKDVLEFSKISLKIIIWISPLFNKFLIRRSKRGDIESMNIQYVPLRAKMLARFVARQMSGVDPTGTGCIDQQLQVHLKQIRKRLETSVIPLGQLRVGSYLERALLFKAIADRICLPAALVRGEYGVSWIEIAVSQVICYLHCSYIF